MATNMQPAGALVAPYVREYPRLWLACLTAEQRARTCGYWYTIQAPAGTPHTAFRTRAALARWLELRGLSTETDIPDPGGHSYLPIVGAYRTALHVDYRAFYANDSKPGAVRVAELSNGDYTLGIVTADSDGLRTVHTLNPNCRMRPIYSPTEARALEDEGRPDAPPPSILQRLLAAGVPIDRHETDLYALDTPEARAILAAHATRPRPFTSEIDGRRWLDIPFAYDPAWERAAGNRSSWQSIDPDGPGNGRES